MSNTRPRKTKKKRGNPFIGAQVSQELYEAIETWVGSKPERSSSLFVRDACREKLKQDGIEVVEVSKC